MSLLLIGFTHTFLSVFIIIIITCFFAAPKTRPIIRLFRFTILQVLEERQRIVSRCQEFQLLYLPRPVFQVCSTMQVDQQELFVVQKCWFDGPHVEPAVDYMALFPNRNQAEETAYQSAHVHAAKHHSVVRTLLMKSGYSFSAAGKLFWVRRVYATTSGSMTMDNNPLSVGVHDHLTQTSSSSGAHVILTNGVIGGTGNANSRRGTEVTHNRVFVGADGSTKALQVMMQENLPQSATVSWVPFGPLSDVMQGWSGQRHGDTATDGMMDTADTTMKRPMMDGQPQQQFHYHATSPRPPKRHCGQVPNTFAAEPADMYTFMST